MDIWKSITLSEVIRSDLWCVKIRNGHRNTSWNNYNFRRSEGDSKSFNWVNFLFLPLSCSRRIAWVRVFICNDRVWGLMPGRCFISRPLFTSNSCLEDFGVKDGLMSRNWGRVDGWMMREHGQRVSRCFDRSTDFTRKWKGLLHPDSHCPLLFFLGLTLEAWRLSQ